MKKLTAYITVATLLAVFVMPFMVSPASCEASGYEQIIIRKETKRGKWYDIEYRPREKRNKVRIGVSI